MTPRNTRTPRLTRKKHHHSVLPIGRAFNVSRWIGLGAALCLAALVAALDLPKSLGAHPWWSLKVLMIGVPIGAILALIASCLSHPNKAVVLFLLATLASYITAKYGQIQFAASYAEDALAGTLWYFGWISLAASAMAFATAVFQRLINFTYPTE